MTTVALDGTKLIILMIAGGAFALAGLWLMFRPKPEGGAAKLELFGAKFEASSAGLLVFLIGAAFMAVPIVVPERESPSRPSAGAGEVRRAEPEAGSGELVAALPLPRLAESTESEPNDTISSSNALAIGQTVRGRLASGNNDWFVFAVDPTRGERLRVTFRNLGGGCPNYDLLDARENRVGGVQVCTSEVSNSSGYVVESDRYYLRATSNTPTEYEIALDYEE